MGKKNYNKISTEKLKAEAANETVVETVTEVVTPEIEEESIPEQIFGVVVNCEKLNVRVSPSIKADVETVIKKGTEVEVTMDANKDFYHVCNLVGKNERFGGYVMKKYISIK